MHTGLAELIQTIRDTDYCGDDEYMGSLADNLICLSSDEFEEVVWTLLTEPVPENEHLRGLEYRNTYRHRIHGCILFAMRPIPRFYQALLSGALDIGDPTSINYGAFALRQVRAIEQIGSDLLEVLEQRRG